MDLSLPRIEERLASHRPKGPGEGERRAAVAALLRFEREAPDVLLMQRASRDGDRWSGQISLPGGREQQEDADLLETARRETHEEVGLDLDQSARLLGRLDAIRPRNVGGMSVTPYVFARTREEEIELGDEAVDAFWFPLDLAARGELDDIYRYRKGPLVLPFPCWRYRGHAVWGLTYRMLSRLLNI